MRLFDLTDNQLRSNGVGIESYGIFFVRAQYAVLLKNCEDFVLDASVKISTKKNRRDA